MALFTEESLQYLEKATQTLLGGVHWNSSFEPGEKVLVSGVYRCEGCGDEITSKKGEPFPP
ncbi:protein L [Pseudomonas sp. P867]|uniref:protein L n=1 Tax=Pseudomonas sp. P867 TaxID=2816050 RepID=UPI00223C2821|nr:protein L [Pseudomonas sp. P867]